VNSDERKTSEHGSGGKATTINKQQKKTTIRCNKESSEKLVFLFIRVLKTPSFISK